MTIVLLDAGATYRRAAEEQYGEQHFGQLGTPLSRRVIQPGPYALDNGCFKRFERDTWLRQVADAHRFEPIFVALPDVVGSARRTMETFTRTLELIGNLPAAIVTQDGIADIPIPWEQIEAVFIGGSDAHKDGDEAMHVAKAAKILGKWVHVGRVNTAKRMKHWHGIADSIDGSGISRYSNMLEDVMRVITGAEDDQMMMDFENHS